MKRRSDAAPPPQTEPKTRLVKAAAVLFFLAQLVALPGAYSPFRMPKDVLATTCLAVIVAIAVLAAASRKHFAFSVGPLSLLMMAYPALLALSALWSVNPRHALAAAATTAAWVAALLWLGALEISQRRRLVWWCAAGTAVSAGVGMLQVIGFEVLPLTVSTDRGRLGLTGMAGNPADLAMASALVLPMVLPRGEKQERQWQRWLLPAVLTIAILLTRTLTGFAGLGLMALVWLIQRRSARLWLGAVAVGIAVIIAAFGLGIGGRLVELKQMAAEGKWSGVVSGRVDGWTASVEMIKRQPLLGVGARQFSHSYYPARLAYLEERDARGGRGELATHFEWSHCDPLQLVAELGVLGLAWLLCVAVLLVRLRPRGDGTLALAAAAVTPFALLHYPTHLAVGLIPILLILASSLANEDKRDLMAFKPVQRPFVVLVLFALAITLGLWQARRVWAELWRGDAERVLVVAQHADAMRRGSLATAVEQQAMSRISRLPGDADWLWRVTGQARLLKGDAVGAEAAFRASLEIVPHEEAEFGLGLALASQGRRPEAVVSLARVCRTNPALLRMVVDEQLRRAVRDYLRIRADSL